MPGSRSSFNRQRLYFALLLLLTFSLASCQVAADPTATPAQPVPVTTVPPTAIAPTATQPPPTPTPDPPALPTGTAGYPWWNDTVFYQIFVRSFYDTTGDGIGDLNGVIEKLDYLQQMGVSGIWLMPIKPSPSYHGYDVTDFYDVNPEYGTKEDFHRLMEAAHERGIRVIIDLVLNHTSTEHPWFRESRLPDSERRDWYIWVDEAPSWPGPWGQVVWHRTPTGYYYGVFWGGMPDLNFENPAVTEEMFNVVHFWLEEMGVDGFRLDAIKHLIEDGRNQENTPATLAWFEEFYAFYKDVNPEAVTVAEVWSATANVLPYVDQRVDIAFEFDLAQAMINSANNGSRTEVAIHHTNVVNNYPPGQYATFLANHDQNRTMSQLGGDFDKAKLAATLLLTSPGVPFIYYGEEIGMMGVKPDENLRLPMQWSPEPGAGFTSGRPWRPLHRNYQEVNVALQDDDPDSLLNHYRSLIQLRNQHPALRVGDWLRVNTVEREVYSFIRVLEDEVLLVLFNLSDRPVDRYRLALPEGPLPATVTATLLLGEGEPAAPTVNEAGGFSDYRPFAELPPQSSFIIRLGE
jgi:alpha-amylase